MDINEVFAPVVFFKGPKKSFISVIKYSPDGNYLGVGTKDGYAGVLNIISYRWQQENGIQCSEHSEILDVDFSENSDVLAAATNSVIILCNPITGDIRGTINVSLNSLFTHLCFGKEKILAAATANFLIYIFDDYDVTDRINYNIFNLHLTPITSLKFINHSYIVSSDARGYCIKWDSRDYPIPQERFPVEDCNPQSNPHPIKIFNISVSPDHDYVLLTHMSAKLTSWEILDSAERVRRNLQSSLVLFQTYTGHVISSTIETKVKAHIWFTPNWKWVISGSEDRNIYIWNFTTAEILQCVRHFTQSIYAVPNPVNGLEFISLQRNGTLCVWKKDEQMNI